ncbi:DUF817 domain-containing protein [Brevibacterium samyangense]|uniref:DUF817 domain-containing protein n=1 Tax=Brevibacterium samyangense TaxID=366888 RepID=A0ABP5EQ18_9MICO
MAGARSGAAPDVGPASEAGLDRWARRRLAHTSEHGVRALGTEFLVFVLKQAWAALFGGLMLAVLIAAALWYPDDAALARNDALVLAALAIQAGMLAFRLETGREALGILLFHLVGTVMEVFKTSVGSWEYAAGGVLHIGAVPLYTGFMYAAVGSYLMRVMRLHDLRFTHYPPLLATVVVAAAVYANFYTHHYWYDLRWVLVAAILVLYARCVMHARIFRRSLRMPVVLAFVLVALFIWIAENVGTAAGAWIYPDQADGWRMVSLAKLGSWFLLMNISVVLVTLVHRPATPEDPGTGRSTASSTH